MIDAAAADSAEQRLPKAKGNGEVEGQMDSKVGKEIKEKERQLREGQ